MSDSHPESKDISDSRNYSHELQDLQNQSIDYSGAGYASDGEDSSLVHHRPSTRERSQPGDAGDAAAQGNAANSQTKPKSLLQRLVSIKRPKPDTRATINPRKDRYSMLELDDVHDGPADDMPNVDISFFEGFPTQFQSSSSLPEKKDHGRTESDATDGPSSARSIDDPATDRKLGSAATVDLSVLEGLGSPAPKTDDSLNLGNPATTWTNLSYFYPLDPEQPNWKPTSMRSVYIIMLAIVSLALAGVQEYLCQKSRRLQDQGSGLIPYDDVTNIPAAEFFCWKYLPTLVTVCYGVLWQVTDYEVQRLEPYYQLSQPTGNTAEKSLSLDYVTMWSYFVPYKAIKYRHWTVLTSVIGTILATTAVPSLQSPSIKPDRSPNCPPTGGPEDFLIPCSDGPKFFLRIHPVWSRLVTSCLALVAVLAIILLFQLRRKSGLLSDPLGVAGVAAMANRSHILAEFQGMDESLHDDIHKKLRHRRYILYKSTIWQGEYTGKGEGKPDTDNDPEETSKPPNPQPIILRPVWLISFIIFMVICLPFVPAICYNPRLKQSIRQVPWLPVLVATLIKQLWSTLEFNVKMLEPFHTLSKGNARPDQTLTLDYQGTPYGAILLKSLLNRHWLVALVALGAILADIQTVTLSSLSLRTETPNSYYSSSVLSTTIVAFMILSAILIFIRRRRPFMPRQPSTIASILAFIHQSRMLDDFTGTERFTNKQMQEMLVSRDKRYGLGWFRGRDCRPHCAVDQEPMLSRYVHGVSYVRATAPWEENV